MTIGPCTRPRPFSRPRAGCRCAAPRAGGGSAASRSGSPRTSTSRSGWCGSRSSCSRRSPLSDPLLYVFWWLAIPAGDPAAAAQDVRPSALTRLARRQAVIEPGRRIPVTDIAIGAVLVIAAALLIAVRSGADVDADWLLPALIVLAGLWLAWSQLDELQRGRLRDRAGGRTPVSLLRVAGGILLAGVGVLLFVGLASGEGVETATLAQSIVAALVMLGGVALVLTPVVAAAGAGARRRAGRPRAGVGACGHRRPPARLRAPDAGPDPVAGRRLRGGRPHGARAGARAARVALRRPPGAGHLRGGGAAGDRRRGRGLALGSDRRPGGRRVGGGRRPRARRRHRGAAPGHARGAGQRGGARAPAGVALPRGGRVRGRGVRARPRRRVRPRRGGHRPVRGAGVDHRAGASSWRRTPPSPAARSAGPRCTWWCRSGSTDEQGAQS